MLSNFINHGAMAACDKPVLLTPAQMEIGDIAPRIEWSLIKDADHYMVWIESRVPEGRVQMTEEVRTKLPFFVPTRPLTNHKATVRVRVAAMCKDNTKSEMVARFRIDGGLSCKLDEQPATLLDHDRRELRWGKPSNAQAYEVRVHSSRDGKTLQTMETQVSSFDLSHLATGQWVVEVQPLCSGIKGQSDMVMVAIP